MPVRTDYSRRHPDARSLARSSLRFADAQEQASALSGWNQDYLQLSAGAFEGELAQVEGAGIKLFVERVQQSVLQTGYLPRGVLALGVPLNASGGGMFCGRSCDVHSLHVFSGSQGFEFRTSRQHTMLGLELQLGEQLGLQLQAGALTQGPRHQAHIKHYVMELYQSARCDPTLLSKPAVVASIRDFLLDQLLHSAPAPDHQAGTANAHWALVQRAVVLVNAVADSAPTVTQLCLELGVSRRTLQNAFVRVLDIGPLAYVKAVRLKQARLALKNAHSVTEAATACGFWHFGHFAHDYQTLFGERPSDTLKRQD
ncbi:MAG: helix-turn-helix domain-containing protein [Rhodoferax sp.]|nr:helix-turn-helix domain-containing protein [Rhodoferax sp.]